MSFVRKAFKTSNPVPQGNIQSRTSASKRSLFKRKKPFLARFGPGGSKAFRLQTAHDGASSFFLIFD